MYDKEADDNKEATFKLARDTKNPTAFEKERHLGTYRTTQSMAFAPPPEVPLLMPTTCLQSYSCPSLMSPALWASDSRLHGLAQYSEDMHLLTCIWKQLSWVCISSVKFCKVIRVFIAL